MFPKTAPPQGARRLSDLLREQSSLPLWQAGPILAQLTAHAETSPARSPRKISCWSRTVSLSSYRGAARKRRKRAISRPEALLSAENQQQPAAQVYRLCALFCHLLTGAPPRRVNPSPGGGPVFECRPAPSPYPMKRAPLFRCWTGACAWSPPAAFQRPERCWRRWMPWPRSWTGKPAAFCALREPPVSLRGYRSPRGFPLFWAASRRRVRSSSHRIRRGSAAGTASWNCAGGACWSPI